MDAAITMTGWVGGDVEHRVHANLTTASFRLGCTPRIFRQNAWTDDPTTWITVNCFRGLADNVSLSLHKGDPVVVSGRLRTQTWIGKEDGVEHERLVLEATTVGHDLTRGVTKFAKSQRAAAGPADEPVGPAGEDDGGSDGDVDAETPSLAGAASLVGAAS